MKFIVFSDVHIGGKFNEKMFLRGVEAINESKADFYVFTGDLTDQGTLAEYELATTKYLPMIKKPVLYVPGNHDVKNVGDLLWEEYMGNRFFCHTDGDLKVKILGLDSNEPDQNTGRLGEKGVKRIYDEFQELDDSWVKVLVFHHQTLPIKYTGRERSAVFDAGSGIKAMMDCNIDLVLNGHRHISNVYTLTDGDLKTLVVNCGTMSCKKTRYKEEYSITQIEIIPQDGGNVNAKIEVLLLNNDPPIWNTIFEGSVREHILPKNEGELLVSIAQVGNTEFSTAASFKSELVKKAIFEINSLKPNFIFHTGDVTLASYPEEFELAKKTLEHFKAPLYIVPGPRDYFPLGYELYPKYFGDPEQLYKGENYNFYGINSCMLGEKIGRLGRSTGFDIKSQIGNQEKLGIIGFHHNIIPLPNSKHESELQDAGDQLHLMRSEGINLVLTGAKNRSGSWQIDNTVFVNCGTLSSKNIVTPKGNSFNFIKVFQTSKGKYYKITEHFVESGEEEVIGQYHIYD